ncbi:hypothetical protein MLD38_031878 [Melastoma candidum]|uniref:Uncharacterized protein n=1 Tax=Melastoma candidum TaxID=119954 RepID=A0ACB9MQI5_9MYRT|nr:hypothetical protein MLD38_031878 [Melastoma candidum]
MGLLILGHEFDYGPRLNHSFGVRLGNWNTWKLFVQFTRHERGEYSSGYSHEDPENDVGMLRIRVGTAGRSRRSVRLPRNFTLLDPGQGYTRGTTQAEPLWAARCAPVVVTEMQWTEEAASSEFSRETFLNLDSCETKRVPRDPRGNPESLTPKPAEIQSLLLSVAWTICATFGCTGTSSSDTRRTGEQRLRSPTSIPVELQSVEPRCAAPPQL